MTDTPSPEDVAHARWVLSAEPGNLAEFEDHDHARAVLARATGEPVYWEVDGPWVDKPEGED